MLLGQPASWLTWPCRVRVGSWQARHICPLELSRTRNCCASLSLYCTWGSWQLVHSTFPLTSFTFPVGSAVLPCDTREATRFEASFIGVTRLNGCELLRFCPNESPLAQLPVVWILP